ncbi:class II aldolase/adducin family protein [Patescibacteria group bacterium]
MSEEYTGVKYEAEKVGELSVSPTEQTKINQLISLRDIYTEHNWLDRNGGNFSFRAERGFIIKTTGVWIEKVTDQDFARVTDVQGEKVFYEGNKLPSSECRTHFYVYQKNPQVNFIFHAHVKEIASREDLTDKDFSIPEQPYGTMELAKEVSEKAKTMPFVIAINHGVFAFGDTFQNTLKILLENYAQYRGA